MNLVIGILWAIIAIIVGSFLKMVVIPNLSRRITLRKAARTLKRKAKEQEDPEQERLFNEVAKGLKELSKESIWTDDDEN